MTCDLDRVDALADGRLDGPEAKEVMEHLAGCPQCRAYYEGALAADRVLADTGINPPADFAAGVMERIRPRRQVQWPRAAAGLAACLLLAAGATLALPQAVPEPPAALARQGIAPDHRGVYRLTPRQMETLYIQAPELALIHMGSVFLLDSMG